MLAHEVLRRAAEIIKETGWSAGSSARDINGAPIPLWHGDVRAGIHPAAVSLSIYGAIAKVLATEPCPNVALIWKSLESLSDRPDVVVRGGTNHLHPVMAFNDAPGRTESEVLALIEAAAVLCEQATEKRA